jgi:uncharacterized repeat protein (TIGR03803 family)
MSLFSTRMAGLVLATGVAATVSAQAATETVLHVFTGGTDGAIPEAGLIEMGGVLYGTTAVGGGSSNCREFGCGTVFSVTTAGNEKVIYVFRGNKDGSKPSAGLTKIGNTLYGVTYAGGGARGCHEKGAAPGCGTVFSVTSAGKEKVVYAFQDAPDANQPQASLINVGGTLYGTSASGGANQSGTVFSVTPGGTETVLHSFIFRTDGSFPYSTLVNVAGTFYGTTNSGGPGAGCHGSGCGTVFSMTPSGAVNVLHTFEGGTDGSFPWAGLTNVNGTFYGTTFNGGSTGCDDRGCGTVFSLTPAGAESVVHAFGSAPDAENPLLDGNLTNVGGTLYGTTTFGGAYGYGTVFSISPEGVESVIYSFQGSFEGGTDGAEPWAGLINVDGTLYGTTTQGGGTNCAAGGGCGTVFAITP